MTARPDVPDTPDRTDAIARVRAIGVEHRPASVSVVRASLTCVCGHESTNDDGLEEHRAELIVEALLDFATLAERHPDALLTALTNAGVLTAKRQHMPVWGERPRTAQDAGLVLDDSPVRVITGWAEGRILTTAWREVQQP